MYLGIDLGGTKTAILLSDHDGHVLDRIAFPTQPSRGYRHVIEDLQCSYRSLLARNGGSDRKIHACGVSCGALLDPKRRVLLEAPNLPGWIDVPIAKDLEDILGIPVNIDNDANACALAEHRFGAGRNCDNMVFLTFGTGIGAGLILNGALYRGFNNLAGETGHMTVAEEGPTAYGKQGSLEAFASGTGIALLAQAAIKESGCRLSGGPPVSRADSFGRVEATDVAAAARRGDPLAITVMERAGNMLGRGIALIVDLLNPERVVIGSIFVRCEALLRPSMEATLSEEALPQNLRGCRVVPAGLGEQLGDLAAISLAMQQE